MTPFIYPALYILVCAVSGVGIYIANTIRKEHLLWQYVQASTDLLQRY